MFMEKCSKCKNICHELYFDMKLKLCPDCKKRKDFPDKLGLSDVFADELRKKLNELFGLTKELNELLDDNDPAEDKETSESS